MLIVSEKQSTDLESSERRLLLICPLKLLFPHNILVSIILESAVYVMDRQIWNRFAVFVTYRGSLGECNLTGKIILKLVNQAL